MSDEDDIAYAREVYDWCREQGWEHPAAFAAVLRLDYVHKKSRDLDVYRPVVERAIANWEAEEDEIVTF